VGATQEIRTQRQITGDAFTIWNQLRAVTVISQARIARLAKQAVTDNRGMWEDPDEAMEAIANYVIQGMCDITMPDGDEMDEADIRRRYHARTDAQIGRTTPGVGAGI
jgi:hypothetical protein